MKASTQTAQALAAYAKDIKLFRFHASSLRKRANNTIHCQDVCANTLFAPIACTCRGRLRPSKLILLSKDAQKVATSIFSTSLLPIFHIEKIEDEYYYNSRKIELIKFC